MGNNVDDIPWPKKKPKGKKQKKTGSPRPDGTTVGMAIVLFLVMPAVVVLSLALFLAHGYHLI